MKDRNEIIRNVKEFTKSIGGIEITKTYTYKDYMEIHTKRDKEWEIDDIVELKRLISDYEYFNQYYIGIGNLGNGELIFQVNSKDIEIWR